MTKELQVLTGPAGNQQSCIVQLNNVAADDPLTPRMARSAASVAHGQGAFATVWDWPERIGYRLGARSARKLNADGEL